MDVSSSSKNNSAVNLQDQASKVQANQTTPIDKVEESIKNQQNIKIANKTGIGVNFSVKA